MVRARWWMMALVLATIAASVFAGRLVALGMSRESEKFSATETPEADSIERRLWPVHVSVPDGPPRVATGTLDALGREVTVSCASCHSNLEPNLTRRSADAPAMAFHQGLIFDHGGLSCVSCHNPQNYNTLRLADGATVPYPEFMTMCAQCHAPQARDWEHGAHGGMIGHWDRTRGPRSRKSCIDCHDPHAPKFPSMTPTFKPIDRFLPAGSHAQDGGEDVHD